MYETKDPCCGVSEIEILAHKNVLSYLLETSNYVPCHGSKTGSPTTAPLSIATNSLVPPQ